MTDAWLGDSRLKEAGYWDGLHKGRAMGWDMAAVPAAAPAAASCALRARPGSWASQRVLMMPQATRGCSICCACHPPRMPTVHRIMPILGHVLCHPYSETQMSCLLQVQERVPGQRSHSASKALGWG